VHRAGVAADMLDFMLDFLDAHPDLKDNDVFVSGESYAGHYVPAVTHRLWRWNKANATEELQINIKGLAIGVALFDACRDQ
jgi:carboxypeptidase C (cathepsin A)